MPDFTKLLELTGPKALGLFIACVLLRLANVYGFVHLSDISSSAAAINDVVAFVSGALALMWIAEALFNWVKLKLWEYQHRELIQNFLLTLSQEEADLLELMSRHNQQSMTRPLDDPIVDRLGAHPAGSPENFHGAGERAIHRSGGSEEKKARDDFLARRKIATKP